jgi:hypothetical protein
MVEEGVGGGGGGRLVVDKEIERWCCRKSRVVMRTRSAT